MKVITLLTLLLSTTLIFGDDTTPLKIMFFGDSVISGVHNSEVEVCPFRYEFLRHGVQGSEVQVVGTNQDKEGTCQKIGEELSVQNNGYQHANIDDLLDYITADLQYLYNPVDYIFTSIGLQDCLTWKEGGDFQILSQSVRRIMGRLLNLNENAKIYHLPIMLPPSAGKVATDCMNFVNKKLRDLYDPKQGSRIAILDPIKGKQPTEDLFIKIGGSENTEPVVTVTPVVTQPAVVPQEQPSAIQNSVITTPTITPVVTQPAVVPKEQPSAVQNSVITTPKITPVVTQPAVVPQEQQSAVQNSVITTPTITPVVTQPAVVPQQQQSAVQNSVKTPQVTPVVTQPAVVPQAQTSVVQNSVVTTPTAPVLSVTTPAVAPLAPTPPTTTGLPEAAITPQVVVPSAPSNTQVVTEEPDVSTPPVATQPIVMPQVTPPAVPGLQATPQITPQAEAPAVPNVSQPPVAAQANLPVVSAETAGPQTLETPVLVQPSGNVQNSNEIRRMLKHILEFLPNQELSLIIANVLVTSIDWDFRAQTPTPTMEVTKEPDYYGYDWCMSNYEDNECFEYYYGYVWCLKEYTEDECYNYYYGDVESWEEDDSYKWCLNFYDEEYCSFAYLGEEPETWDWLSFGYHDCTKVKDIDECFEQYYGYAWCVNEYSDTDCYEYYYGDGFEWDAEKSIKWCLNFYDESECLVRYDSSATYDDNAVPSKWVAFTIAITAGILVWVCYRKLNCFKSKDYSRLNTRTTGGEDEVELL